MAKNFVERQFDVSAATDSGDFVSRMMRAESQAPTQVTPQAPSSDRGVISAFQRGLKSSAPASFVYERPEVPSGETIPEWIASTAGEIIGDVPAMYAGAAGGIPLGAVMGAPFGPAGIGVGASLGGTAGAFALPTLIKQSLAEYRDAAASGFDGTFGDFLEHVGRVGKETGKSALIGAATAQASRFWPVLGRTRIGAKLLGTRFGKPIAKAGLETAGLTGAQAALEGEAPTAETIAKNAMLIGGLRGVESLAKRTGIARRSSQLVESIPEVAEKISKMLPDSVKGAAETVIKGLGTLRQTEQQKRFFAMIKKHVGERDARLVESQFKWRDALKELSGKVKLKGQHLEDAMYYRQKTGNPNIKGDTFKKLSTRTPKEVKQFVDDIVVPHLKESLDAWNKNKATKDINPREAVEEVYLPGLYEFDPKKMPRVYDEVSKQFKTKNPFSNAKKFLTFMDAFKERGLKPRYTNLIDLMGAYDQIMTRSLVNNELLSTIKKYEKKNRVDLIVNPSSKKKYTQARAKGYEPFQDIYLRRYVAGEKEGKPIFATSSSPALVHPEFAKAAQSVFKRNALEKPSEIGRAYDVVSNAARHANVAFSLFHYRSLLESAVGAHGLKGLNVPLMMETGRSLGQDKAFMTDAARSGLRMGAIDETKFGHGVRIYDSVMKEIRNKGVNKKFTTRLKDKFLRANSYLFDEFHPNIKRFTWNEFVKNYENSATAQGRVLEPKEFQVVKRELAELVNNMFGGQQWETIRGFNNPKTMKMARRLIGFPDWTMSAMRQFMDVFAPGVKGRFSANYWKRYMMMLGTTLGLERFLSSGFKQTDPSGSVKGVRWDPQQAMDEFISGDPTNWWKIPLPDVDLNIGGVQFNPGRNSEGKRLYGHPGKQFFEILDYAKDPIRIASSKANPILRSLITQIAGGSPSIKGVYPAQAEYIGGEMQPWGGKETMLGQLPYRTKELTTTFAPFSMSSAVQHGIAPQIASGLGALSISTGISLRKAEPEIRKALQNKDIAYLNRIRASLRDNGYKRSAIKSKIASIRTELRKKK